MKLYIKYMVSLRCKMMVEEKNVKPIITKGNPSKVCMHMWMKMVLYLLLRQIKKKKETSESTTF